MFNIFKKKSNEEDIEGKEKDTDENKEGFLSKLKEGLQKTRKGMAEKIDSILKSYGKIDNGLFDELEEVMVTSDVGINTTMDIIERLKTKVKENKVTEAIEVKELLKNEIKDILNEKEEDRELNIEPSPAIVLVVGVNGVGKTTTVGKLAYNLREEGKRVLIAAGDTFRAAAIEQLGEWSKRAGVDMIAHQENSDPAAVIFDGIQAAKARKTDVLICDTAGRLHNKKNLMNELNKIFRVVEREYGDARREVLLVVDATTGQNALIQAKEFQEVCNISGIVLTKLDGTAKGGVVIALQTELNVPVKLIGVGEGIEDLQKFNTDDFVDAIFD
ncbi:signal recognition particle-docking protein FtsY [Sporanaerobacter sp. PP17-6a]|uniref:signal recognition particle-docking protein FtsY n=1 Tax=Sporanaerobacter sp. PP17-6a TaxID=1891289 RepID=UPI00089FAEA8|nr:signal recognition particle-docking protein FtsY [Sporanaerobacter sp. PP17-6a]SCL83281.1 Signal recognition particle receptor FtsY [Sporanaerobacter sp. PP17-6a]